MKLDKSRPYGTIASTDPAFKVAFNQDGIDYDKNGNPVDKKQVTAYNQTVLAEAQKVAAAAKAVSDAAQADADAAQRLLEDPGSPQTVAQLKEALDEMGVIYTPSALKPELEQQWIDNQAE